MNKLFIPEKIKVGFQERSDTYTGKLSYVTYYKKNKLMKEKSWRGWCTIPGEMRYGHLVKKSEKVDLTPLDIENVPTEGFVLNKKVGGYKSDWNFRQTYCRVYDPRGFEFEIDVPNLLFILQECNAYKGKGLEGEFVYAWDGANLALLPAHCKEYQESTKFTALQHKNIGVKDLEPGCYYRTKNDEQELMYLGKFNYFQIDYNGKKGAVSKEHVFYNPKGSKSYWDPMFKGMTGLSSLAVKVSDTAASEFAEKLEEFSNSKWSGSIKKLTTTKAKIQLPSDSNNNSYYYWGYRRRDDSDKKKIGYFSIEEEGGIFRMYTIYAHREYKDSTRSYGSYQEYYNHWYTLTSSKVMYLENGEILTKSRKFSDDTKYTDKQIHDMKFVNVTYDLEGSKSKKKATA